MSTTTSMETDPPAAPTVQEQAAAVVVPLAAGYVGHRTISMGLRQGLFEAIRDETGGISSTALAERCGIDPFYAAVWCQAALAARILERDGDRFRLAPHMDTLLLDTSSPAHVGAQFTLLEQPEMFDNFEANLSSGTRAWWDDASPAFITNVSEAGRPFYTRLIPDGLAQVPELEVRLAEGGRVLDTACGVGIGLIRLARTYPSVELTGADGDQESIEAARKNVAAAGLGDRIELVHTPLEELSADGEYALVMNNISMHECRHIDRVTANVKAVLEPGGWFVISDIPFPDTTEGLQTAIGLMQCGIQLWEAQIDDQLLPRRVYDDLLSRHGFRDIGSAELAPVHAITYGRV